MQRPDPHEVARQVTLSLVLEPLSEKSGCTTRTLDLDESIRLQHLQAAGVNVASYFYELAKRIEENNGQQPKVYFDLALDAVKNSQKNLQNYGKYINQGLITMLFHVVTASLLTTGDGIEVCKKVPMVLKNSSREDASARNDFRMLVVATSRRANKRNFPSIECDNLFDYYHKTVKISEELQYTSGVIWAEQLMSGLPFIQEMYLEAKNNLDKGLLVAMEKSYELGTRLLTINSPGFVADYVGVVTYLLLRESDEKPIVQ